MPVEGEFSVDLGSAPGSMQYHTPRAKGGRLRCAVGWAGPQDAVFRSGGDSESRKKEASESGPPSIGQFEAPARLDGRREGDLLYTSGGGQLWQR